ncbi:MAG: hypothetical protein J7K40_07270 [candidate division Zixibacteria bacterium]|nr:hypothetical protein [candidate division Zixibacteria bacterium]
MSKLISIIILSFLIIGCTSQTKLRKTDSENSYNDILRTERLPNIL